MGYNFPPLAPAENSASTAFTQAAADDIPPTDEVLTTTPYTALKMDPAMLAPVHVLLKALYSEKPQADLVSLSYYALAPHIPKDAAKIIATSCIDDHNSLQVMLIEVDGERIRPDGIPYHAIWSNNIPPANSLHKDENYRWPVIEAMGADLVRSLESGLVYEFTEKTVWKSCPRVITDLQRRAELLAIMAYRRNPEQEFMMSDEMDILPLNVSLEMQEGRYRHYPPVTPHPIIVRDGQQTPYHPQPGEGYIY